MDEVGSNVVTLHPKRAQPSGEAEESLRLLRAFLKLSPSRQSAILEALEAEALSLPPEEPR